MMVSIRYVFRNVTSSLINIINFCFVYVRLVVMEFSISVAHDGRVTPRVGNPWFTPPEGSVGKTSCGFVMTVFSVLVAFIGPKRAYIQKTNNSV